MSPLPPDREPDAALAAALAAAAIGSRPAAVSRFTTGAQHFVFEARFADRAPVVVRISRPADRQLAASAARLSRQLRPLGMPLPAILAEDLDAPFPYLVLERLPGADLGHVIARLPPDRLTSIASRIVQAQRIVGGTPSVGRYGYAAQPAEASHKRWSQTLEASLGRSRARIAAAGLFDLGLVDALDVVLATLRPEADKQPATPFLHDTTTKNVIVAEDGSFSGIVDVDDLCFGDPRLVVALTLASLTASGGPTSYAETWLRLAGFRDDRLFRLYVALFLLDFLSEEGQVFNGNPRPTSPDKRRALLDHYTAALQRLA